MIHLVLCKQPTAAIDPLLSWAGGCGYRWRKPS